MHESCKQKLWAIINNPDYLQRHWSSWIIYMTIDEEVYKTLCNCWPRFTYRYWMVSWMGICLNWNHQDYQGLLNVICFGVQIKGGHHIGHLLESNLSRHTVILHINGYFKNVPFIEIVLYIWQEYGYGMEKCVWHLSTWLRLSTL